MLRNHKQKTSINLDIYPKLKSERFSVQLNEESCYPAKLRKTEKEPRMFGTADHIF